MSTVCLQYMTITQIIPKTYKTFAECIEILLNKPGRKAFASEIKRKVHSKSWYYVVMREINRWNELLNYEYPGMRFIKVTGARNPKTCRNNEHLVQIDPRIEVLIRPKHFFLITKRGEENEKPAQTY